MFVLQITGPVETSGQYIARVRLTPSGDYTATGDLEFALTFGSRSTANRVRREALEMFADTHGFGLRVVEVVA
jgi:hypothetical protein